MPHLQREATAQYPVTVKRELAHVLGDLYAQIMQTTPDLVDVSLRELGQGHLWRCDAAVAQHCATSMREAAPSSPCKRCRSKVL